LLEGDGERDLAALGDKDRCTSEPGVEARELTLLNGSDLARMRLRLRAVMWLAYFFRWSCVAYIDLAGSAHLLDVQASAAQSSPAATVEQSQC
jgi:hypothetical protein